MVWRMLIVDTVTAGYSPGRDVLRELTAQAAPGRMLAITGSSGAGKTTLLRVMSGLLKPSAGTVSWQEQPVTSRDTAVAQGIVLIPQDNGLATMLTATENLQVVLLANGFGASAARRRSAEALEQVGLSGQATQLVEELSGGQQQRAAIARGLALGGKVLLADEVTSELDAVNRQKIIELLRAEAARGAAVVFATHDPDAAAACDARLHLVDGRADAATTAGIAG
jgi:putative ABC transport system ATP-binding protein